LRQDLPVVGRFRARFPQPTRLLLTIPTAAAKTTATKSVNVRSQSAREHKHAIDTATNHNHRKLNLETDQRRCSTNIGAPPRFQKSPHLNPAA